MRMTQQLTIPHLTRSSLHRCLRRHGISRLPEVEGDKPVKKRFKIYPIGYFHIDIAEVRTAEGKLYLFLINQSASSDKINQLHGFSYKDMAAGLTIHHDNGLQYISHDFQNEITWLGVKSSPSSSSLVRAPEGNGCAERFIRTLKENLLWVRTFGTIEEMQQALQEFKDDYNERWLIQRHRHRSPN